jgi:uncharacterized protein with PQ loop repeat
VRIDNYLPKNERKKISQKRIRFLKIMSKLATVVCCIMYISYIPQIMSNLSGNPVYPLQPAFATINAILWVGYGWLKTYKDWPVIIANAPGIIFGALTLITIYIH